MVLKNHSLFEANLSVKLNGCDCMSLACGK